jgi:hypothetical protein
MLNANVEKLCGKSALQGVLISASNYEYMDIPIFYLYETMCIFMSFFVDRGVKIF